MKIHEYQAKQILRDADVAVPQSIVARSADEASAAYSELGGSLAVVKAQIHAGGRGKGTIQENPAQHGVQLVRSAEEAATVAENLLGNKLVTIQTGPAGQTVRQVLVEAGCDIARELYLGMVIDRASAKPVLMVSTEGGTEIEEVAANTPELIHKQVVDPKVGLQDEQVQDLADKLGLEGNTVQSAAGFMKKLCEVFVANDCSLTEINPLVITGSGDMIALDAKMTFDDNAEFRHPNWEELRDRNEEEPTEIRASNAGLSYVKLDGTIGCLVNGAGLAMSTMDLIKLHGGEPANFLDVGGGANVQQVTEAFRIILEDKNVNAVLVNIFGGIMSCKTIAEAIVNAYKEVQFNVPLVVRLEGNSVEQGREILNQCEFDIITAQGLTDAAKKVVAASTGS